MKQKTIDIHKDYTMYNLMSLLGSALHALVSYMQETTPYGEEYLAVMSEYEKVNTELKKLESALQDCVEVKQK